MKGVRVTNEEMTRFVEWYKTANPSSRKNRLAQHMYKSLARYFYEVTAVRAEKNDKDAWEWVYEYKRVDPPKALKQ